MKNIVIQVIVIIIGIFLCVALSSYIGYALIKDIIPIENIQNQKNLSQKIEDDNQNKIQKEHITNKRNTLDHNKLMIVAHPDDDTIFGGAHLIEDDYTVVCVTCGVVDYRLNEFSKAMKYSGDKYLYLSHTDLDPKAHISDWTDEKETINLELKQIIESQDWDLIVSHNPEGEYGHKHHKMISEMVTKNISDKSKLYYFGKYKEKGTIDDTPKLKENIFKKKKEMLSIYKSQPSCSEDSRLSYSFNHENWIKYSDWK